MTFSEHAEKVQRYVTETYRTVEERDDAHAALAEMKNLFVGVQEVAAAAVKEALAAARRAVELADRDRGRAERAEKIAREAARVLDALPPDTHARCAEIRARVPGSGGQHYISHARLCALFEAVRGWGVSR